LFELTWKLSPTVPVASSSIRCEAADERVSAFDENSLDFRSSLGAKRRVVQDVNSGAANRVAVEIQRYVGSLDDETVATRRVKRISAPRSILWS
jgi:hypothetical protein